MTPAAKHRKGDPVDPKSFAIKPRQLFIGALAAGLLTSAGFAIANQIDIPDIENGAGVEVTPNCVEDSSVNFTYTTATGGATTVTGVTVTGISSNCSGMFISLKILNSSGSTVDEIIWNPSLTAGDSSITLRANGSSTSGSNSSSGGVSTVWPSSQTSPEGLQSFTASQVEEVRFSVLATSRAATN
jgi:hypothetical protein